MKLIQLKYFLAAAKHENMHQAAKELFVTPSTISHSLAALETEFEQELFQKHGKCIRLTESGQSLVKYAQQLLGKVADIKRAMSENDSMPQGSYRIAVTQGYAEHWVLPIWMTILAEYPGINGTLYSMRSHDVVQAVVLGQVDIGICISPHDHPRCQQEEINSDYLAFTFRSRHPLLNKQPVELSQLSQYPIAIPKSFQHIKNCEHHPILEEMQINSPRRMYFDSYNVAAKIIELSDIWALLPQSFLAWSAADKLTCIPLQNDVTRITFNAIWPRGQALPRVLEKLKNRLKAPLFHENI